MGFRLLHAVQPVLQYRETQLQRRDLGILIRFTCIRGERAQDSLAGDPTAPPYLMDIVIANALGAVCALRRWWAGLGDA